MRMTEEGKRREQRKQKREAVGGVRLQQKGQEMMDADILKPTEI